MEVECVLILDREVKTCNTKEWGNRREEVEKTATIRRKNRE